MSNFFFFFAHEQLQTFECFLGTPSKGVVHFIQVLRMQIGMCPLSYFYCILLLGSSTPKSKVKLQTAQRISTQVNKN